MYTKYENFIDAHEVFEEMSERDAISWNCLLFGHARIGQMRRARTLFEEMSKKLVVSWTAMVSGYAKLGYYSDALDFFHEVQMLGMNLMRLVLSLFFQLVLNLALLKLGNGCIYTHIKMGCWGQSLFAWYKTFFTVLFCHNISC